MNLKEKLYAHLQTIDIVEFYGYINEIELGYINANYHPEDNNIIILNYTELTTYEKRWNKYTMSARGLILDLTNVKKNGDIYILAKPFGKFPNYGELPEYEEDIDFTNIESIMEKMDGSLGISYFFNNEIRFATRGSFISEQALKATQIWKNQHDSEEHLKSYLITPVTYLVEIIYPENRVVVDYGRDEKLVLLGVNYLFTDYEADYEDLKWESKYIKMELAPRYDYTIEQLLELKKTLSANEEGWVVKFGNGKRLKIKGNEYLQVHRIMHGLSDKAKVTAWAEGKMNEYIMMLPEEFRPELEYLSDKLDKFKDAQYFFLQTTFEYARDLYPDDRKEFALHVNKVVKKEYRKHMFHALKNGSISVEMIKEDIAKNYKDYIEVINSWKNNVS